MLRRVAIRVGLAAAGVLLAAGAVSGIARATPADLSVQVAQCSDTLAPGNSGECNLSGTIPGDPTEITATATAVLYSPNSPNSTSVQLTVTCDEDGTSEVMNGSEIQSTPYTNVPVWEASDYSTLGPAPESYSSDRAGPGLDVPQ
jgi:hypothetical protein